MRYYCDAAECKSSTSKAKTLHIFPLCGLSDSGKVAEGCVCAEKMEGSDSARGEQQNLEKCLRSEPHDKFQAMFSSSALTTTSVVILSTFPGITGITH